MHPLASLRHPLRGGKAGVGVASTLLNGLISLWEFDEVSGNAVDTVRSLDLIANNSPGTSSGLLATGNARTLNGTNQTFSRTSTAELAFGNESFSITCWVSINSFSNTRDILGKWGTNSEYILIYSNSLNRFEWVVSDSADTVNRVTATTAGAPSTGTTYMICVTHDAENDNIGICVNAGAVDTQAHSTGVRVGSNNFIVGGRASGLVNFVPGTVDQIAVWGRVLTSAEITELYNGGNGLAYPFS